MNIFLYEFKSNFKSAIIWGCCMAGLAILYIFMFNFMYSDIAEFQNVIKSMPEMLKKALSIYVEGISNLVGFYSVSLTNVLILGGIQAMMLGMSLLSKEQNSKAVDFLLTKPISRKEILTNKVTSVLALLITTNILYLGLTIPFTFTAKTEFSLKTFIMISATIFFVQLMFAALGFFISAILGKIKSVIALSISTVFGFFIINMIGAIIGDKAARYLSPFKYFNTEYIIKHDSYETSFIIAAIIFIITAITLSYVIYTKKDFHAV